jgi:hypothetical protein
MYNDLHDPEKYHSSELIQEESEAVDALLNLMGYDPEDTFVSDCATFDLMGLTQKELDEVLPISMNMDWTLLRGIYEIRRSLPNWPRNSVRN